MDLIDRQVGLILHQQHLFADMLLDVAEGAYSAKEALESSPLFAKLD